MMNYTAPIFIQADAVLLLLLLLLLLLHDANPFYILFRF
jgi:hypothetical protein